MPRMHLRVWPLWHECATNHPAVIRIVAWFLQAQLPPASTAVASTEAALDSTKDDGETFLPFETMNTEPATHSAIRHRSRRSAPPHTPPLLQRTAG